MAKFASSIVQHLYPLLGDHKWYVFPATDTNTFPPKNPLVLILSKNQSLTDIVHNLAKNDDTITLPEHYKIGGAEIISELNDPTMDSLSKWPAAHGTKIVGQVPIPEYTLKADVVAMAGGSGSMTVSYVIRSKKYQYVQGLFHRTLMEDADIVICKNAYIGAMELSDRYIPKADTSLGRS